MAALLLAFAGADVSAQSEVPKFEIGAQFTTLRLKEFQFFDSLRIHGLGGRFTYNITDYLAVEAEGNYFPEGNYYGDRRIFQGMFGVKAGIRRRRVGIFVKARPGFLHLRDRLICVIGPCPAAPLDEFVGSTQFAFDVGGVVEFYPSRRIALRVDVGDTIVRFYQGILFIPPPPHRIYYTSHNVQFSSGASFRF